MDATGECAPSHLGASDAKFKQLADSGARGCICRRSTTASASSQSVLRLHGASGGWPGPVPRAHTASLARPRTEAEGMAKEFLESRGYSVALPLRRERDKRGRTQVKGGHGIHCVAALLLCLRLHNDCMVVGGANKCMRTLRHSCSWRVKRETCPYASGSGATDGPADPARMATTRPTSRLAAPYPETPTTLATAP